MSTLLERIRGIREENEKVLHEDLQTERDEFFQIALRDYLGQSKDTDADDLQRVMEFLELSDEAYLELVKGIGQAVQAVSQKTFHDEQMKDRNVRFAETQKAMFTAKAATDRHQKKLRELQAMAAASSSVAKRLHSVTEDFPAIFDDAGNPHKSLKSLIDSGVNQLREAAQQNEADADAQMESWIAQRLRQCGIEDEK